MSRAVHRIEFINWYSICMYTMWVLHLWNWCLGFWMFVISILILLFQPLMTHSDELDETTWLVSQLPLLLGCCTDYHQLIMVSFIKWSCACALWIETLLPSINVFYAAKMSVFYQIKLLCCLCCYFILNLVVFCKFMQSQRHFILHMSSKVFPSLSIAFNYGHQDSAVFHLKT